MIEFIGINKADKYLQVSLGDGFFLYSELEVLHFPVKHKSCARCGTEDENIKASRTCSCLITKNNKTVCKHVHINLFLNLTFHTVS